MTQKQINAAKARLEAARKQSVEFTPNGFSGQRSQTLEGEVLFIEDREYYKLVFFTDNKGGDWTLTLVGQSDVEITEDTTTVKIAKSKSADKENVFYIVGAE